ncbi:MAG TPA: hypothetical protein VFT79_01520 [Solirubrobacterales bacterium]|nr:hypothetical protein [Solirubrobacterales bacterium]
MMKLLKALALAAVAAAALMATVGAGSAAATETALCNSPTTNLGVPVCANQHLWEAGTVVHAASETFLVIETDLGTLECEESTIKVATEKTTAKPLGAKVESLTFSKCGEATITTVEPGTLDITIIDVPAWTHDGTLTFTGTKIKVVTFGLECSYALGHAGRLTGAETATIDLAGTATKIGGSFFCPAQARYLGFYKVTESPPIYVST